MASDFEAVSYEAVATPASTRGTVRWSRAVPLMLLVPIVVAFGTPVIVFVLLAAVLAAPAIMATIFVIAARDESGA